jgi:serine/threonine protein kinase
VTENESTRPETYYRKSNAPFELKEWLPGQIILDGYKVVAELGHGGMGRVFRVERKASSGVFSFAVKILKSTLLNDPDKNRAFLAELRTWIDLPAHPNLTACRFFQTIGKRLAIFAEYVDGGSLKQTIGTPRLETLVQILDAAIQTARGLHVAHMSGIVHQDVKPANILIASDGTVKVTDFGLASASRHCSVEALPDAGDDSFLVSSHGMTPAYCSPEQVAGSRLTRGTDIWSFGVTLLEMLVRRPLWSIGALAHLSLPKLLGTPVLPGNHPIPNSVMEVLEGCFREDAAERWADCATIAALLEAAYEKETGAVYPRIAPPVQPRNSPASEQNLGRIDPEKNPWQIAQTLCRTVSRDIASLDRYLCPNDASPAIRNLTELEMLEELLRWLDTSGNASMIKKKVLEAEIQYARGFLLSDLGDNSGAQAALRTAADILESMGSERIYSETIPLLARIWLELGLVEATPDAVISCQNRISELLRAYPECFRTRDRERFEVSLRMNIANAEFKRGNPKQAAELTQEAVDLLKDIIKQNPEKEWILRLANVLSNLGVLNFYTGMPEKSILLLDECISNLRQMQSLSTDARISFQITRNHIWKAIAENLLKRSSDALAILDDCLADLMRLKLKTNAPSIDDLYVKCLINKGYTLFQLQRILEADELYSGAVSFMESLVYERGRFSMRDDLALLYANLSETHYMLDKKADAFKFSDLAIEYFTRLVTIERKNSYVQTLATLLEDRAEWLANSGRPEEAGTFSSRAGEVRRLASIQLN